MLRPHIDTWAPSPNREQGGALWARLASLGKPRGNTGSLGLTSAAGAAA